MLAKYNVSSRAPVWGANIKWQFTRVRGVGFKSCPRVGGIPDVCQICPAKRKVSSRAPVWGASGVASRQTPSLQFQVVPPCGGHLPLGNRTRLYSCFKSCPRVGGIPQM